MGESPVQEPRKPVFLLSSARCLSPERRSIIQVMHTSLLYYILASLYHNIVGSVYQ